MWSSKRQEAPQVPKPEPRSFQTNQPINPPQAIPSKGEPAHGSVAMGDSIVARLGPSLQKTPAVGVVFFLDFSFHRTDQDLTILFNS